jgi:menaquinone-dependent protoporphyrinogen oxidase
MATKDTSNEAMELGNRKPVSRRDFLKIGCLGSAAAGLGLCAASVFAPGPPDIDLQTFRYGEDNMNERILIAYASATGSTVGVAAAIGRTLAGHGVGVDVRPIREISGVDGYTAVVLGSAVQYCDWLPEAIDFVKANQPVLKDMPLALFCVHIRNLGDDPASRKNRLAYLDSVRPLVEPAAEGYFAGRFNRQGAAMLLPPLAARFVPTMDFRNWKNIRSWTENAYPRLLEVGM